MKKGRGRRHTTVSVRPNLGIDLDVVCTAIGDFFNIFRNCFTPILTLDVRYLAAVLNQMAKMGQCYRNDQFTRSLTLCTWRTMRVCCAHLATAQERELACFMRTPQSLNISAPTPTKNFRCHVGGGGVRRESLPTGGKFWDGPRCTAIGVLFFSFFEIASPKP